MRKFKKTTLLILPLTAILSVSFIVKEHSSVKKNYPAFFKIGHRGIRGLMPENTIPAMIKAVQVGANTLELDVHITRDGKVIVYHDESFDPAYTLMPDGSEIPPASRKKYTFYQLDYKDIKLFIIGKKPYPVFPQQQLVPTYTPLLGELIDSVDAYTQTHRLPMVHYLVEIKSDPKTDSYAQPEPETLVKLLMQELEPKQLGNRLIIQSFDMRPLRIMHKRRPEVALGFLTADTNTSFDDNLKALGFKPVFYNPANKLADARLVESCHKKGILITPWTINEMAEMKRVKELHADGIITDYANYFEELK